MSCPVRRVAKWLHAGDVPVYVYFMNRKLQSLTELEKVDKSLESLGVFHGSELFFVWGYQGLLWGAVDKRLSQQIMSYWANFARAADPNSDTLPQWPDYQVGSHMN